MEESLTKEGDMGGAWKWWVKNFGCKTKMKDHFENLGIDGGMMIKCIVIK
jgi:hypothetical protein